MSEHQHGVTSYVIGESQWLLILQRDHTQIRDTRHAFTFAVGNVPALEVGNIVTLYANGGAGK